MQRIGAAFWQNHRTAGIGNIDLSLHRISDLPADAKGYSIRVSIGHLKMPALFGMNDHRLLDIGYHYVFKQIHRSSPASNYIEKRKEINRGSVFTIKKDKLISFLLLRFYVPVL